MNRRERRAEKKQARPVPPRTPSSVQQMFAQAAQHHQAGRLDQAVACYRRVIDRKPDDADAHCNLGIALQQQGLLDEAIAGLRRAVDLNPDLAVAHGSLGISLQKQGRRQEAVICLRRAIALKPDYAEALGSLGLALEEAGLLDEAVICCRRALERQPNFPEVLSNLGSLLHRQGLLDEAVTCLRRAIELRPGLLAAYNNLGRALTDQGRLDEAVTCLRRAIELDPDLLEAHDNLGHALTHQGRLDEALASYAKALEIKPDHPRVHSNLLFASNYRADQSPEAMRDMAQAFGALVTRKAVDPFSNWAARAPGQPLRVGLVSGDLRYHAVGFFLEGILGAIDPDRVEFLAFPSTPHDDELSARIKPKFKAWTPIHGLSDAAAAHVIHAQGVQVLIDLSGHTGHNRLPVFGWRPAPVQASWMGYFATTGVAEMDYFIGDPTLTPPHEAGHFTEALWPLPEVASSFTPPAVAVSVSALPARSNGHVTFGCFSNLAKVCDAVIALWARVLTAVPGSKMKLKAKQFRDATVRGEIAARFAAHGIEADRLIVEPPSERADYLRAYHGVDIMLDTFPYPGGTTSVEALWMGVPVLTRHGDRFLSHVGETIVRNAGLPDWIAAGDDEYVAKAASFAADLDQLASLRARLRDQVLASPLFDTPRFSKNFEDAMWGMWNQRLALREI